MMMSDGRKDIDDVGWEGPNCQNNIRSNALPPFWISDLSMIETTRPDQ